MSATARCAGTRGSPGQGPLHIIEAVVTDEAYRQGRRAVLPGFLARERLFFTEHFRACLEDRARANLSRTLERMDPG